MNRKGGLRRKSKHKLTKERRQKGKVSVSRFMQVLKPGQRVHLDMEPAVHKGMYHTRFFGKPAVVTGKRGDCYEVLFNDKGKEKTLIVHPVHLKV